MLKRILKQILGALLMPIYFFVDLFKSVSSSEKRSTNRMGGWLSFLGILVVLAGFRTHIVVILIGVWIFAMGWLMNAHHIQKMSGTSNKTPITIDKIMMVIVGAGLFFLGAFLTTIVLLTPEYPNEGAAGTGLMAIVGAAMVITAFRKN